MYNDPQYAEEERWVIWNGTLGILDTVTIGEMESGPEGTQAWLEEPYDMVGPFSFDELEANGQIEFAACVVMSRQRWQEDQVELRRAAHKNRREFQQRQYEEFARYQQRRNQRTNPIARSNDKPHRELLNLPLEGELQSAQIKAAYRKLAQKAHPDVGGSHEQFVLITEARDVLLALAG